VVERCISYLYITWDDTTQCVPVNYTVMLTNASSGELLHTDTTSTNYYNFTGLTSDTLYTVTITGRNRVGQHVVINQTSSLKSNGKALFIKHICVYIAYMFFILFWKVVRINCFEIIIKFIQNNLHV